MADKQTPMHDGKRATRMAGMPDPSRVQGHSDYDVIIGPGHDSAFDRGDGQSVNTHRKKTRVDTHVTPTGVLRHTANNDAPQAARYNTHNVPDRYAASRTYQCPSGLENSKDPKVKGYDVTSGNQGYESRVTHYSYPDVHDENDRTYNEIQINNISDAIPQTGGGDPFLYTRGLDGSPNMGGKPEDPKSPSYSPTATGAETPVTLMEFRYKTKGPVILIYKQDITKVKVDVIVNEANAHLRHEGGVARAIADAAGSELARASEDVVARYGPVPVSGCVATPAGRLPCQRVLHAVGPKWTDTPEQKAARQLQDTFVRILEFCCAERVTSIAIPPISAGMDGGAAEKVSDAIVKGLIAGLNRMPTHCDLTAIHLVDIDGRLLRVIQTAFTDEARKGAVLHRVDRPMDYY